MRASVLQRKRRVAGVALGAALPSVRHTTRLLPFKMIFPILECTMGFLLSFEPKKKYLSNLLSSEGESLRRRIPDPKLVVNSRVRRVFLGKDWTSARGAAVKDLGRTSEHHGEGRKLHGFIEGQTALIVRGGGGAKLDDTAANGAS